jgi:fluoride exporter
MPPTSPAPVVETRPDQPLVGGAHEGAVLLWIGMGGALGALARFALGGWVTTWAGMVFPWGTFAVNVIGSVALGATNGVLRPATSPYLRAFLTVGLCGGFTTFSTFDLEVFTLFASGRTYAAAAYAGASAICCIAGIYLGRGIVRRPMERP